MIAPSTIARRWIHRVGMGATPPNLIYTGVFLDPMDAQRLLRTFGKTHPERHAHHMTLWHFSDGAEPNLDLPWGKTVVLKIIGHVQNELIQVAVVQPTGFRPDNGRTPHITISTQPGVGPKTANSLLAGFVPNQKAVGLPVMRGKIGWADSRGDAHYNAPV